MVCVALQETSWTAPPEVKAVLGKKAQVYHICLCSPLRFTLFDGLDAWLECPASHRVTPCCTAICGCPMPVSGMCAMVCGSLEDLC